MQNPKKKPKKTRRKPKKTKCDSREKSDIFTDEKSQNFQLLDYHIEYLADENDVSLFNTSNPNLSTSDKSTACHFEEFGDFWPYLATMKLQELIKNKRFCFMLNNPQFLRKDNRIYLENLAKRKEITKERKQRLSTDSKTPDVKEVEKRNKNELESASFATAVEMMKRDFPNYYQYLKSYYTKKKMNSLGNKDNKEFKDVILYSSNQKKDYLEGMEQLFRLYSSAFV